MKNNLIVQLLKYNVNSIKYKNNAESEPKHRK